MSKTAWFIIAIMFIAFMVSLVLLTLIEQEPVIHTLTIEKIDYTSVSGNFTMTGVKIEIPSRSLDWLPLAGITMQQELY